MWLLMLVATIVVVAAVVVVIAIYVAVARTITQCANVPAAIDDVVVAGRGSQLSCAICTYVTVCHTSLLRSRRSV